MKKKISIILLFSLLLITLFPAKSENASITKSNEPVFNSPGNPAFLQYYSDNVYATLEEKLGGEKYVIEEVRSIYISPEYLEEIEYYSRANIYFGYTLEELDARFEGKRYIFTLGEDKQTIVKEFEGFDESEEVNRMLTNIAIGTGVILVCVVITVFTEGTGTPEVIQIIHAIAHNAATEAVSEAASGAMIGAASAAIVELREENDLNSAMRSIALSASEGFKWGALEGSVKGGLKGAIGFANSPVPSWSESEAKALEIYDIGKGIDKQVPYLNGEIVSPITRGATIPDIVRTVDGHLEFIEVKNYDCKNHLSQLLRSIKQEISDRCINMPEGTTQRVVLDVRGRGYSQFFADSIREIIQENCQEIYPNLPVDFIW